MSCMPNHRCRSVSRWQTGQANRYTHTHTYTPGSILYSNSKKKKQRKWENLERSTLPKEKKKGSTLSKKQKCIKITAHLSPETMQARREWNDIFSGKKKNKTKENHQFIILYLEK